MKKLTTFNFMLNTIGIILLLLIATIEYYNKIILSGIYVSDLENENIDTIYMFLRMSLWKIHLISGVLLSIVILAKAYLNANALLLILGTLILGTGGVNFYLQNNILSSIHIFYSIVASYFFIYLAYQELNRGKTLC